jgi:predicted esterase
MTWYCMWRTKPAANSPSHGRGGCCRFLAIGWAQLSIFAATHPDAIRGVIGVCGGLPGDWDDGLYLPVSAAVLHIARSGDEYYPPSVTELYAERLRRRAADVEYRLIDSGHQMPSSGSRIVEPWLRRVLA